MTRVGFLSIAVFSTLILTILAQQDLKCWSCNNFNQFCDDPFDASKLNNAETLVSTADCPNGRCVKTIANTSDDQPSVNRFCASTPEMAAEHCKDPSFTSCEACETDKCNSASLNGPIAVLVAISVAIAKIFLI